MRGTSRSVTVVALFSCVCAGLGFAFPAVAAEGQPIFTLSDPKADDHGDGTLQYPLRPDMQPGDLDLVSFSASPAKAGGTVFEVTFARSVRAPERRPVDRAVARRVGQVLRIVQALVGLADPLDLEEQVQAGADVDEPLALHEVDVG